MHDFPFSYMKKEVWGAEREVHEERSEREVHYLLVAAQCLIFQSPDNSLDGVGYLDTL